MDIQGRREAAGTPAIELDQISYTYPSSNCGVHDVSLRVLPSTVYGLLGINGAGKTTLMRLMTGLLAPSSGSVRCFGSPLGPSERSNLRLIGSLIEAPSLYAHLTAREHLGVFSHYTAASRDAVDRALELAGIADVANRLVRHLSLGMKQRLGLATALLHDPPMLILDEPTNGLDPAGISAMRDLLRRLASEHGKTIIVSSHLLAEVEKTATRIGIMHAGALHFEGTAEDLSAQLGSRSGVLLRVNSVTAAEDALDAAAIAHRREADGVVVEVGTGGSTAAAIAALIAAKVEIHEVSRRAASLESDFLSLIGIEK